MWPPSPGEREREQTLMSATRSPLIKVQWFKQREKERENFKWSWNTAQNLLHRLSQHLKVPPKKDHLDKQFSHLKAHTACTSMWLIAQALDAISEFIPHYHNISTPKKPDSLGEPMNIIKLIQTGNPTKPVTPTKLRSMFTLRSMLSRCLQYKTQQLTHM